MENKPTLIRAATVVDDRGEFTFSDQFIFDNIKRFYVVKNHQPNFIRAWHGHKYEAKYCMAMTGTFLVGAVEIDDWDNPSHDLETHKFTLSANQPAILYIPPGYANGIKNLTADSKIIFWSTSTFEEAKIDDYRYIHDYWNIWEENYR
jgi:dTDP-4-dehydrorhamnose 3,5-epimerase